MGLGAAVGAGVAAVASGIGEAVAGAAAWAATTAAAAGITATGVAESAGIGAALGAGTSAVTGGNPLIGGLTGGLTGGLGGVGGALGGVIGGGVLGEGAGTALGGALGGAALGAGGGALGAGITGQKLSSGALGGALSGGVGGLISAEGGLNGLLGDTTPGNSGTVIGSAENGTLSGGGDPSVNAMPGTTNISGSAAGLGGGTSAGATTGALGAAGANAAPIDLTAGPSTPGNSFLGGLGGTGSDPLTSGLGDNIGAGTGDSIAGGGTGAAAPTNPSDPLGLGSNQLGGSVTNPDVVNQLVSQPDTINNPQLTNALEGGMPAGGANNVIQSNAYGDTSGYTMAPATGAGAGTTAGNVAGTAAGKTNWGDILNHPLGTLGSAVGNNAQLVLGGLGLGYDALKGEQQPTGEPQLQSNANTLSTQGQNLVNSALNNALPPGAQAQLNQAAQAMKAQIQSSYSSMGLGGSTMEAQAMGSVDTQISSQGYQMMQQLMQQGMSMEEAANTALNQIMALSQQQSNQLSQGVSNFAGALGGRVAA